MEGATKIAESERSAQIRTTLSLSLSNNTAFTIEITRSETGSVTILSLESISQDDLNCTNSLRHFALFFYLSDKVAQWEKEYPVTIKAMRRDYLT